MKKDAIFKFYDTYPDDTSGIETLLIDIYEGVRSKIANAFMDKSHEINGFSARKLINMIAGNLVINLTREFLKQNLSSAIKMEIMEDTINELSDSIRWAWQMLEANSASEAKIN